MKHLSHLCAFSTLFICWTSLGFGQDGHEDDLGKFYLRLITVDTTKAGIEDPRYISISGKYYVADLVDAQRRFDTIATFQEGSVISLARFIDSVGFFEMDSNYSNEFCKDGPFSWLTVESNGKRNDVKVYCTRIEEYQAIVDRIITLTKSIESNDAR
jgi:hypothetical protein